MAQDSSCDEDVELDLEGHFPMAVQVEVEETVVDLTPEQVRMALELRDYDPIAEADIENPDDLQQVLIR